MFSLASFHSSPKGANHFSFSYLWRMTSEDLLIKALGLAGAKRVSEPSCSEWEEEPDTCLRAETLMFFVLFFAFECSVQCGAESQRIRAKARVAVKLSKT